jgi:hypothetical protein
MRASERQRASGEQRPAWPGNAVKRKRAQISGAHSARLAAMMTTVMVRRVRGAALTHVGAASPVGLAPA